MDRIITTKAITVHDATLVNTEVIFQGPPGRSADYADVGVLVTGKSYLDNVIVYGARSAGILVFQATPGTIIRRSMVIGALADGIHITDRSSGVLVEDCAAFDCGDDGIAVVSYRSQGGKCSDITIRRFYHRDCKGRGFPVVGGDRILYDTCSAIRPGCFGLYVMSESAFDTYGSVDVEFRSVYVQSPGQRDRLNLGDGVRVGGRAGGGNDVRGVRLTGRTWIDDTGRCGILQDGQYTDPVQYQTGMFGKIATELYRTL